MKAIKVIGVIGIIGLLTTGCSELEEQYLIKSIPKGFEYVSTVDPDAMIEIRNMETGAHYYLTDAYLSYTLCPVINSKGYHKVTEKISKEVIMQEEYTYEEIGE